MTQKPMLRGEVTGGIKITNDIKTVIAAKNTHSLLAK